MTAATEILDALRDWGIRYVFCCPGTTEIPLLDALAAHPGRTPEFVLTTHEAISVSMADGYSRASGGMGVAYLHTNVGLANGLAHLYAAQVARSSVAVLTGIKSTRTLPHRALTTSPRILETAAPYAGRTWQNLEAADLVADIDRTLRHTVVSPESPAVLAIPEDHLSVPASGALSTGLGRIPRRRPSADDVRQAAELLRVARRPLIVAGSDVARRGAQRSLEQIALALGAPVYVESRRDLERWAFRSDHPNFVGLFDPRSPIATDADLLLLAGAPTPLAFSADVPVLPDGVPLLHVTEDPDEVARRFPVVGALVGDTALALADLDEAIANTSVDRAEPTDFLVRARNHHTERAAAWSREVPADSEGADFSAAAAMRVLAESLGGERLIVLDGVTSTLPLLRFVRRTRDDTLFATASGSLGWGMGAAAGVALARNERTIAVVGDGVVQFGIPAFWTVCRYRIPVTYIVVNNGRYQAVVSGLTRHGGAAQAARQYPLTDITGLDMTVLAASFGIPSERVRGAASLRNAVEQELRRDTADGPHVVEVMVNDTLWQ